MGDLRIFHILKLTVLWIPLVAVSQKVCCTKAFHIALKPCVQLLHIVSLTLNNALERFGTLGTLYETRLVLEQYRTL